MHRRPPPEAVERGRTRPLHSHHPRTHLRPPLSNSSITPRLEAEGGLGCVKAGSGGSVKARGRHEGGWGAKARQGGAARVARHGAGGAERGGWHGARRTRREPTRRGAKQGGDRGPSDAGRCGAGGRKRAAQSRSGQPGPSAPVGVLAVAHCLGGGTAGRGEAKVA